MANFKVWLYEWLPNVCFNYGKYEHNSEKCPDRIIIDEKTNRLEAVTGENKIEKTVIKDVEGNVDHILKFSPWMVVTRKGKNQLQNRKEIMWDPICGQGNNFG